MLILLCRCLLDLQLLRQLMELMEAAALRWEHVFGGLGRTRARTYIPFAARTGSTLLLQSRLCIGVYNCFERVMRVYWPVTYIV